MACYLAQWILWIFGVAVLIPSIYGCTSDSDCPRFFLDSSDEYYCCDDFQCCDYDEKYSSGFGDIIRLGIGAIIGIVCGIIALIVFISVAIACCCCGFAGRSNTTGRVVAPRQTVSVVQTSAVTPAYANPQPAQQYYTQPAYAPQAALNPSAQASYPAAPAYPIGQQGYPMSEQQGEYKPPMPQPYHEPPPNYHS